MYAPIYTGSILALLITYHKLIAPQNRGGGPYVYVYKGLSHPNSGKPKIESLLYKLSSLSTTRHFDITSNALGMGTWLRLFGLDTVVWGSIP
jgi:hypothetical protein